MPVVALAAGLVLGACTGGGSGSSAQPTSQPIPQPPVGSLNRVTRDRLAPPSQRVDLSFPTFTHPTEITNPLFPIGSLDAVIVGEVEGRPLKIETTLLPDSKVVSWRGRHIEALQSQFCAFLDGRITEVAVDLYAQADDGSVWYLGEDVVDYVDGSADATEGTWRVGVDGPPAMIMPGEPRVGDVYRTENIPGVAFEQVTIRRVGVTVDGPTGPVRGAIVAQELHQDESSLEKKVFAPGYGEFFSGGGHDFEANALSVPADARPGAVPAGLRAVTSGLRTLPAPPRAHGWSAVRSAVRRARTAWDAYRTGSVPTRLADRMDRAIAGLEQAVADHRARAVAQAALHVTDAGLDLELEYRSPAAVNLARFDLWTHQLSLDAAARAGDAVHGDLTTLAWLRDRLTLDHATSQAIDDELRYLGAAADAGEYAAVRAHAARIRASEP